MIDYYQNKVECFSKTLCTVNNINQLLKELTEFNKDFQDSEYHNIFFQKLINNYSISIIILFVSFIMAFSGKPKTTFMYMLFGSVLIYVVNLIRIVILSIGFYHYPWRKDILHTVIFPGIIYGMVFLLWIFWVNRFSNMIKKNE